MRLLAFGTYDTKLHPRVQVVLEGLRAHGDAITEVDAPLGLNTAARVAILQHPWRMPALLVRLLMCWFRLLIGGRRAARGTHPDAVIVGYMGQFDVHLARILFRKTPIVLDQLVFGADTAQDRGISGGWKARLLRGLDHSAIARANVVMVDTTEHQDMAQAHNAERSVVVPVGATQSWFTPVRPRTVCPGHVDSAAELPPLRVVFFGLFTPLQGAPVIGEALHALADSTDLQVLMVGRGQDYAATRSLAADIAFVEWRDWVPCAELPDLVGSHDVCLGIFSDRPKAMHVVPNKIYQGAAAGCALITSDTPPQRRTLGDVAEFVPAGDGLALAAALRSLAADRPRVAQMQAASRSLAEAKFRPDIVAEPLRAILMDSISKTRPVASNR